MRLLSAFLLALLASILFAPALAQIMPDHRADLSVWGLILAPIVWVALIITVYWYESRFKPAVMLGATVVLLATGLVLL